MLAERVKAGNLPPVDQRLPEKPFVVKPEKVGVYGGNWRMVAPNVDTAGLVRTVNYENLVQWNLEWTGVLPNVEERWEVNKDATEFTFYLRKGMRWSDGEPFTAEDIVFWREVLADKDLTPLPPREMKAGGKLVQVSKVDATTVKFSFAKPYGLFLEVLATPLASAITMIPKHYAKQYTPKYTDKKKLDEVIKAEGFRTAGELFAARVGTVITSGGEGPWQVAGRPTIRPWVVEQPFSSRATQIILTRNPYYWKVDTLGQQYPYIDKVTISILSDVGAMVLKAANGEIDYESRHFNTLENKAVLFDNQKRGDYHFQDLTDAGNNKVDIYVNMTHKDKAMRRVFQSKDFRIGLSYAINRQEIIDTVYLGQGRPFQCAPLEGTPFYNKQLATQYTEYDVKKANEHLDKAGLDKRDANGMRLRPDGKPFAFVLEATVVPNKDLVDVANMLVRYWRAVGITVQAKPEDRTLLYQRKDANDLDAMLWFGEGGVDPISDPRSYFPNRLESPYGIAWSHWYMGTGSEFAEEPPMEVRTLMDLYDRLSAIADKASRAKLMNELLQRAADLFLCIGVTTPPNLYGIIKNALQNVPSRQIYSYNYPTPAPAHSFTWFFSKQ
jgi:peptide/nickel transport system substrate-binding protein